MTSWLSAKHGNVGRLVGYRQLECSRKYNANTWLVDGGGEGATSLAPITALSHAGLIDEHFILHHLVATRHN